MLKFSLIASLRNGIGVVQSNDISSLAFGPEISTELSIDLWIMTKYVRSYDTS